MFGCFAATAPAYLARPSVQGLGLVAVLAYLVALLAALVVIVPRRHPYASASITQQREVFAAIVNRKRWALVLAVWAFGIASVAFAGLFVAVAFGL